MSSSDNSRGALLMSLAMAAFTCNDALTKSVMGEITSAQIMSVRGVLTMAIVFGLSRYMGVSLSLRALMRPLVLLRTFCEIGATLTFLTALAHIEFSALASIMQSLPLVVTLGAALFLGEPVGWRRWTAIAVGLAGVLIILRPGPDGMSPAALYAVAAMFFTAGRDLVTRRIHVQIPTLAVTFFTCIANTVMGTLLIVPMGGWQPLSPYIFSHLVVASILVVAGYQAVVKSMRSGEISFIAPFRYTSLVWALAIGIFVFGEHPDGYMLAGAAIVIASGLYSFYRERKRQRGALMEKARAVQSA